MLFIKKLRNAVGRHPDSAVSGEGSADRQDSSPTHGGIRMTAFWGFIAILFFGWLAYSNTFHSSFHYDDEYFVMNNPNIRNITDLKSLWNAAPYYSRFVAITSFALNYHFGKLDTFGYHVVNFSIHILATLGIWWLIYLVLSRRKDKNDQTISVLLASWAGAMFFLLHPLQTQAVTYIVQRFSSLAAMFSIFSMCFYVCFRISESRVQRWVNASASLGFLVLAMFTKEESMVLPLLILLVEMFFLNNGGLWQKAKAKHWLYVILLIAALSIIPFFHHMDIKGFLFTVMPSNLHEGDLLNLERNVLTQFRVLVRFLQLVIWPTGQNLLYDFPMSISLWDKGTVWYLGLLILVLGAGFFFKKKKPFVAFGIFWFFIALLPNFIPRMYVIFEHKMYLAGIGFWVMLASLIHDYGKNKKAVIIGMLLFSCLLTLMTFRRNAVWKDEVSLWSDIVKKNPFASTAVHNLGGAYYRVGQYDKSLPYFNRALELNPTNSRTLDVRGRVYMMQGKIQEAINDFTKALYYDCGDKDAVYNNRGILFQTIGRNELALSDFDSALKINPQSMQAFYNRGAIKMRMGQTDQAFIDFQKAIALDPAFILAYVKRGSIYFTQNQIDKAWNDFQLVIKYEPQNPEARLGIGAILLERHLYQEAIKEFSYVLTTGELQVVALYNRFLSYASLGANEQAFKDAMRLKQIMPQLPEEMKKIVDPFIYAHAKQP